MAKFYVSYLRVSTSRQGQSGLGLEAQREQVESYVRRAGGTLLAEHVEVESGKDRQRPILAKSIAQCRRHGATLAIAKLDRLARSVAFISSLMEAGTDFVAVDMPFANRLMLHLMAAFAEHERTEIGARTRAALSAAKARGVVLGKNGHVLAKQNREAAQRFAEEIRPAVLALKSERTTIRDIARKLNERGICTREGKLWGSSTTQRLLQRLELNA